MLNNSTVCTYKYSDFEKSSENKEDFLIIFSADSTSYASKPPDDIIGCISNGILSGYRFGLNIKDLVYDFISKGKSVSPSIFLGERSRNGFIGAQSIWLDFDSKELIISPEKVYETLLGYGIKPNVFYHTFGHSSSIPKFRYVIALDRFIRNGYAYQYLLDGFNKIFTGDENGLRYLDQNCISDISRIYHGTDADYLIDYVIDETYTLRENTDGSINKEVIYYGNQPTSYDDIKLLIDSIHTDPFNKNCNGFRKVKDFDININTHCIYADKSGKPYDYDKIKVLQISKPFNPSLDVSDTSDSIMTYDRRTNYIYNRSCGDTSSVFDTSVSGWSCDNEMVNLKVLRDVDCLRLGRTLGIVNDFIIGRMLIDGVYVAKNFDYNTLKLFAISFLRIQGGIKWITEVMKHHRENGLGYRDEDFALLKNLQHKRYRNKYHNPNLKSFSPYQQDHNYISIYDAARGERRGSVEIIKQKLPQPISLNMGENLLKETFQKVINQKTKGTLDLIQAAIGLGKTRMLINQINHKHSGTIIAFVTHQLKNQFINDLIKEGYLENIDFIATPQVPMFDNPNHNIHLEHLFITQEFKKAKHYIWSIYIKEREKEKKTDDAQKAKEYYHAYMGFIDSLIYSRFEGTIITTHSMCHYFDFGKLSPRHDTYIFDEDLYSGGLISTDYLLLDDLKNISEMSSLLSGAFKDLLCRDAGIYINDIDVSLSAIRKHLSASEGVGNKDVWKKLMELKQSKAFAITKEIKKEKNVYKLLYSKRIKLKPQMKYVVLSATAPENLYQFEGIKTKIHNHCKFIKQKGKLIQYTTKSFSQSSLSKSEKLPDNPDNLPVITFMKHKDRFDNATQNIHIFNILGYNDLEGKDFMAIGTPHMNPYALALLAIESGLSVDFDDKSLMDKSLQELEHNGLKFKMFTFNNETLRSLSNQLTESELQQTVGRARLLRYNATVHLYSNFPLWQVDEFVY